MSKFSQSLEQDIAQSQFNGLTKKESFSFEELGAIKTWLKEEKNNCSFDSLCDFLRRVLHLERTVNSLEHLMIWLSKPENMPDPQLHNPQLHNPQASNPRASNPFNTLKLILEFSHQEGSLDFLNLLFSKASHDLKLLQNFLPYFPNPNLLAKFILVNHKSFLEKNPTMQDMLELAQNLGNQDFVKSMLPMFYRWFEGKTSEELVGGIVGFFSKAPIEMFAYLSTTLLSLSKKDKINSENILNIILAIQSKAHHSVEAELITALSLLVKDGALINNDSLTGVVKKITVKLSPEDIEKVANSMPAVISRKMLVQLLGARFEVDYQPESRILKKHKLAQSLSPEGAEFVRSRVQGDLENLTLCDLYACITSRIEINRADFFRVLEAKTADKLKAESLGMLNEAPYLNQRVLSFLDGYNLDLLCLPQVKCLCRYLHNKTSLLLQELPQNAAQEEVEEEALEIIPQQNAVQEDINFVGTRFSAQEQELSPELLAQKEKLALLLRGALRDPANLSPENFQDLYNLLTNSTPLEDAPALSSDNIEKLQRFFLTSHNEISQLLQIPNGLANFTSCMAAFNDGCHANIGNQVSLSLAQAILTDWRDKVLCCYFLEEIFTPIVNSGEDVIYLQTSVFLHDKVLCALISPTGFVKGMIEYFYNENLGMGGKFNCFDFLRKPELLGEDKVSVAQERLKLANSSPEEVNQKMTDLAEICAYLIVKNSMPELFDNPQLAIFVERCEKNLDILESWTAIEMRARAADRRKAGGGMLSRPAPQTRAQAASGQAALDSGRCNIL